jgi:hypothetical protein
MHTPFAHPCLEISTVLNSVGAGIIIDTIRRSVLHTTVLLRSSNSRHSYFELRQPAKYGVVTVVFCNRPHRCGVVAKESGAQHAALVAAFSPLASCR